MDKALVTITGPGGAGKTRLALQASADALDDFLDGVFFIPLAPIMEGTYVSTAIAQVLGLRESASKPIDGVLKEYLRDKQMLLILDNFEHLMTAIPLVSDLLSNASRLKVLVTSRVLLHIYGEHEQPVPPMALPDRVRLPSLERLTQYEAVRLFIERARATKADFAVTNDNAPAVAGICFRLDGLPLAIELAATRVRLLPPDKMLVQLENRLRFLTGGARDLPARQQTLRNTIDWSYDLLTAEEQVLFRRLSVFINGCTLEAAEAVCNATRDFNVSNSLESLADKSLLQQREADSEIRFVMFEMIRDYAQERLIAAGEHDVVQSRHLDFYTRFALHTSYKNLEREYDNLIAALRWAIEHKLVGDLSTLSGALGEFWLEQGRLSEGQHWLQSALEVAKNITDDSPSLREIRGNLLFHASDIALGQGNYAFAQRLAEENLELQRSLNDQRSLAIAYRFLGNAIGDQGDYSMARSLKEKSLELFREMGDQHQIAIDLSNLADTIIAQGDYKTARRLLEESLLLKRQFAGPQSLIAPLINLGHTSLAEGDYKAAHASYAESLTILQKEKIPFLMAHCLAGYACLANDLGHIKLALELCAAIEALCNIIGMKLEPVEHDMYERTITSIRPQLDEVTYATLWDKGHTLTIDQAVELALANTFENYSRRG